MNSKYKEAQLDEYIGSIDESKKAMYQALVKDDLTTEDILFDVYMWLRENVPLNYIMEKTPDLNIRHILSESRMILTERIQCLIDSVDFDESGIKKDIGSVLAFLRTNFANSEALISDINIQINKKHLEESMFPMKIRIREYFRHLFSKIRNSLGNFPSSLVKFDDNVVSFLDGDIYKSSLDERLTHSPKLRNEDTFYPLAMQGPRFLSY